MSSAQLFRKEQDDREEWEILEFIWEKPVTWEQFPPEKIPCFQAAVGLTVLPLRKPVICALFSVQFELEGWGPYFHASFHVPLKEGYEKPSLEIPQALQEILWEPKQVFFPKTSQVIYCGNKQSCWQNNDWVHREMDLQDTQWHVGDFVTAYYVPFSN